MECMELLRPLEHSSCRAKYFFTCLEDKGCTLMRAKGMERVRIPSLLQLTALINLQTKTSGRTPRKREQEISDCGGDVARRTKDIEAGLIGLY